MPNKNEQHVITIDGLGEFGEGVGRVQGFTVFVEGALPGEEVLVHLLKVKKHFGFGKIVEILKPSENRVAPPCPVFGHCGGCSLQHLDYPAQLEYKQNKVQEHLRRIGGLKDVDVPPVLGMENPWRYRNKAQFPVGRLGSAGAVGCGFYKRRSHQLVAVSDCALQQPGVQDVLKTVQAFLAENAIAPYDEETHQGLVRHVLVKNGFASGEMMVCLVINGNTLPKSQQLVDKLSILPHMASICININKTKGNVILGDKTQVLWGKPYIEDAIGHLRFQISAESFFQVNPVQTKVLYDTLVKLAGLTPTDVVVEAYAGIGAISLFIAGHVQQVVAIESLAQAVEDAKENAAINGIDNVTFITGMAEEEVPRLFAEGDLAPQAVIVDPPRKGCDPALLEAIAAARPAKVVYVSCNPASLARDAQILGEKGYRVTAIQPVDCFPMTPHVETVMVFEVEII